MPLMGCLEDRDSVLLEGDGHQPNAEAAGRTEAAAAASADAPLELSTAPGTCGHIRVTKRGAKDISYFARKILISSAARRRHVSSKALRAFIRVAWTTSQAVRPAGFNLRAVWDELSETDEDSVLRRAAQTDLKWWADFCYEHAANGTALFPQGSEEMVLCVETSGDLEWGAEILGAISRPGPVGALPLGRMDAHVPPALIKTDFYAWADTEVDGSDLTVEQVKAVSWGVRRFGEQLHGKVVRLWGDAEIVANLLRYGTSKAPVIVTQALRTLSRDLARLDIDLRPRANRPAPLPGVWTAASGLVRRDALPPPVDAAVPPASPPSPPSPPESPGGSPAPHEPPSPRESCLPGDSQDSKDDDALRPASPARPSQHLAESSTKTTPAGQQLPPTDTGVDPLASQPVAEDPPGGGGLPQVPWEKLQDVPWGEVHAVWERHLQQQQSQMQFQHQQQQYIQFVEYQNFSLKANP
ncbi:hypothetical protein T484DRAFT_2882959 [Baffinella frigidus]|nr:hypothetical protein T484DRAFT_2882959 [Cryptophyta sp. CCMP2293]